MCSIAVVLSVIGAGLVTYGAVDPYIPKTAAFAGFCWVVALSILAGTIYIARTK